MLYMYFISNYNIDFSYNTVLSGLPTESITAQTMATIFSLLQNASQSVPTNAGAGLVDDSEHPSMFLYNLLEINCINCIGIPGNIATLIVLVSSTRLRKKSINCFLIHQSAVDLWVCILVIVESILVGSSLCLPHDVYKMDIFNGTDCVHVQLDLHDH